MVRQEWLDLYILGSIEVVQQIATEWLWTSHKERPNTGFGGGTPAMKLRIAAQVLLSRPAKAGEITSSRAMCPASEALTRPTGTWTNGCRVPRSPAMSGFGSATPGTSHPAAGPGPSRSAAAVITCAPRRDDAPVRALPRNESMSPGIDEKAGNLTRTDPCGPQRYLGRAASCLSGRSAGKGRPPAVRGLATNPRPLTGFSRTGGTTGRPSKMG